MKKIFIFIILTIPVIFLNTVQSAMPGKNREIHTYFYHFEENNIRERVLKEFKKWEGVKYKFGGNSEHGIDCSALIQRIFNTALTDKIAERLQRTTNRQINQGRFTARSDLRPGDLIFFRISAYQSHVGIYIGEEQFIHASTSRGVVISNLYNGFWKTRYITARRVIT